MPGCSLKTGGKTILCGRGTTSLSRDPHLLAVAAWVDFGSRASQRWKMSSQHSGKIGELGRHPPPFAAAQLMLLLLPVKRLFN